ncbi:MAG: sulfatase-like hydrolase/transferase [Thiobacillus sp.]|nr:sulfatase-like hydrolase/transferase [Thiobacillus sp.]
MKFLSSRFASPPFLPYAILFLAIASLTRLALALQAGLDKTPFSLWPGLLLRGIGFDLAVLAWLLAPMLLWAALWPARWRNTRWQGGLRLAIFFLVAAILLFGALSEWVFWEEFATRFNFIAVDYLVYTHEVIGNIVESYPVPALLAGVAALAALPTWLFRSRIRGAHAPATQPGWRVAYAALALALPWGAWQLADIDQMQFSDNTYANELAGNGLMTFSAAFLRNELDYDRFYATLPAAQAQHILGELGIEREPLSKALNPDPDEGEAFDPQRVPFKRPPKNVVLISVESLSAKFLGSFGNPAGLTPQLDALARDGLLYTHLYATGTRTVRGLEALSLGTPPIPGQAIVRRPGNEHLATIGEILRRQGYETLFLYGGYGYFDNMNAYFAGNDYRVVDRTDFPKVSIGFANVWGVADEFLFDNSLVQLDRAHATGKPFLAQIMTTSNHRPFTYPDGRIDIPSPGKREGAVKYTDYAIGHFIDQARSKPWFNETLFVIVADHCASAAGNTKLPVAGYHIPLILYAPALLEPGRDERVASQIDIPPTLLDAMGLPGDDHFFGQSLFEQRPENQRAFISNYQELGYLKGGKLVVLGPKQRVDTFLIDANGDASPTAPDARLRDEAVAYYQTAFKAFKEGALKMGAIGLPR